jgi:hypothetical protein
LKQRATGAAVRLLVEPVERRRARALGAAPVATAETRRDVALEATKRDAVAIVHASALTEAIARVEIVQVVIVLAAIAHATAVTEATVRLATAHAMVETELIVQAVIVRDLVVIARIAVAPPLQLPTQTTCGADEEATTSKNHLTIRKTPEASGKPRVQEQCDIQNLKQKKIRQREREIQKRLTIFIN